MDFCVEAVEERVRTAVVLAWDEVEKKQEQEQEQEANHCPHKVVRAAVPQERLLSVKPALRGGFPDASHIPNPMSH